MIYVCKDGDSGSDIGAESTLALTSVSVVRAAGGVYVRPPDVVPRPPGVGEPAAKNVSKHITRLHVLVRMMEC